VVVDVCAQGSQGGGWDRGRSGSGLDGSSVVVWHGDMHAGATYGTWDIEEFMGGAEGGTLERPTP
jgi:hypothetical protein